MTRTVEETGGIDVVVNNAANALAQPLGDMTPEARTKYHDSSVRGRCSSYRAFNFATNVSMYAAGKAALLSFTRSMAAAYAPYGIPPNALAPGPVDTDMVRNNPQEAIDAIAGAPCRSGWPHPTRWSVPHCCWSQPRVAT